jgi:hypothetical protein
MGALAAAPSAGSWPAPTRTGGVGEFNFRTIGDLRVGDRVRAEAGQLERR